MVFTDGSLLGFVFAALLALAACGNVSPPHQPAEGGQAQPGTASSEVGLASSADNSPIVAFRVRTRAVSPQSSQPHESVVEVDAQGRERRQSLFVKDGEQELHFSYVVGKMHYATRSANRERSCIAVDEQKLAGSGEQPYLRASDIYLRPFPENDAEQSAQPVESGIIVNGFLTDRYVLTSTEKIGDVQLEETRELWVARGLNVVVRERNESIGTRAAPSLIQPTSTRMASEYAIERIEGDFAVDLPPSCRGGGDVPFPPGAKDVSLNAWATTFETDASPAETETFYREAMAQAGWALQQRSGFEEAVLIFGRDERQIQVQVGRKVSPQTLEHEPVTLVLIVLQ
ncbi:MAG: hypothetical protein RMM31_09750 [Anaerolineae bacterium]|nr:hypothetical protein [Thermoflexales bacterium]MDW8396512.1 hypothetical protein [Anaerolineae bacterium]